MAEKELRKEIEEIISDLEEIKGELEKRFSRMKKMAKPALMVLAGLIGLKIALSILGIIFRLLWKMKLVIIIALLAVGLKFYTSSSKEGCRA